MTPTREHEPPQDNKAESAPIDAGYDAPSSGSLPNTPGPASGSPDNADSPRTRPTGDSAVSPEGDTRLQLSGDTVKSAPDIPALVGRLKESYPIVAVQLCHEAATTILSLSQRCGELERKLNERR